MMFIGTTNGLFPLVRVGINSIMTKLGFTRKMIILTKHVVQITEAGINMITLMIQRKQDPGVGIFCGKHALDLFF